MSDAARPGEVLADHYRVERLLGSGGFGSTHAAVDTRDGTRVAVKQLDLRRVDDWKSVELFEREAATLRRLAHPRIPRYVDFVPIAADRAGLLIQELAPGRSLRARLEAEGRLEEEVVRAVAEQVLEVLIYLGSLDPPVVHRDIKPANLVMDDGGQLRVVDFGAVKEAAARASTVGSTVAGTFGYMAPEVIYGTGEPRSDLYSLGMTLVTLLTGLNPTELPQKRLKPDFRGQARASQRFLEFVERLVEPVPDDRYPTPHAALTALRDAVISDDLEADPADLGALVAARDLDRRRRREQAALAQRRDRDRAAAKLARRPTRVVVARSEGRTRIEIAPKRMRELLWEQAGWGFGFAFVNPGVFIMMGIGAFYLFGLELGTGLGIFLTVVTWIVLLTLANMGFATLRRNRWVLDVVDAHYALHRGNPARPELLGTRDELKVRLTEPDPSALGHVDFDDPRGEVRVEKLSDRDIRAIREGLAGVARLE